ncbi:MAG: putative RND superfamily exporter protein [Polaribacter sp.]|jgi:predicted RND superfamily exporter protein
MKMANFLINLFNRLVLNSPIATLIVVALVSGFFIAQTTDFELDASSDSLILENDEALKYFRSIAKNYGSEEFLIVTYSPKSPLFSANSLTDLTALRDQLKTVENVKSVVSMLDVPLISSPPVTLTEIAEGIRTLESDDVDIALAKIEMTTSPLYKNLLVSAQGDITALQVNLESDGELFKLNLQRDKLYGNQPLSETHKAQIQTISNKIKQLNLAANLRQDETIKQVRAVMDLHRDQAELFLGGVPMIVSDSIDYIRSDLKVFGVGVVAFIILILTVSFRSIRWVVLPLVACVTSALVMMGFLGWMHWPVTVVSSNFISLLLIITLSLVIHLIVRYREVAEQTPDASQFELVSETIRSKFLPCVYTAVTTMVAFGSLLVSGIRPVIDFGWMMVIGISIAFILAFTLFPAALMLMPKQKHESSGEFTANIMVSVAEFIQNHSKASLLLFIVLAGVGLSGLPQLSVENRFIDYYKEDTEIFQGMSLIDEKLGGTTPMDIIIDAPIFEETAALVLSEEDDFFEEDEFFGEESFDDEDGGDITSTSYWFNSSGLLDIAEIHAYLESLPETGKVLSIDTGMRMLQTLNDGVAFDDFTLAVLYKRLPDSIRQALISPYLSEDGNQLRFSIRIYESDKNLKRQQLIDTIHRHLVDELGLKPAQVNISGMAVLYNNLLQSLFKSQILTIGVVFIAILFMFTILFRAIRLSIAAIVPNMIAAGLILGLMGWIGIPLDIMTITISAISIGIGVDNSIHYVHRFRAEYAIDQDYWAAIKRSHNSIGHALYYTTVTVVLGFSILALSNFIPTIYFGLLSGLAMTTALIANLMLLPVLIVKFKLH